MDPIDPDVALMVAFQQGDEAAFEQLLGKYHRCIVNFIYKIVNNSAEAEEPDGAVEDRALDEHLKSCKSCAGVADQLSRTWEAMSAYPSIEPSPDFLARFHRRLEGAEGHQMSLSALRPITGWQWMALAACALVMGSFFVGKSPPSYPPSHEAYETRADQIDEELLQDLDQSLRRTDANRNYLPVYDSWEGTQLESPPTDLFETQRGSATDRRKSS